MEQFSNSCPSSSLSSSKPTQASDLSDTTRSIHIVTTAALPWMTGTAVNPLLRALYFQQSRTSPDAHVTLVIPWVESQSERLDLYGPNNTFSDGKQGRMEQELYIRKWAEEKAQMKEEAKKIYIQFYPARYQKKLGSILTLVDICSLIPASCADVAILEEPEHLCWLSLPSCNQAYDDFLPTSDIGWTQKFKHVVGIIHTNYPSYMRDYGVRGSRTVAAKTARALIVLVCRAYCHKIIKLSATLPVLADYKECVCNTHGVRSDFFMDPGSEPIKYDKDGDMTTVYFIGKTLWAKGFNYLLLCQEKYYEATGKYFPIDVFGGGPDLESIKRAFFGVRRNRDKMSSASDSSNLSTTNSNKPTTENVTKREESPNSSEQSSDDEHEESFYSKLSTTILNNDPSLVNEMKDDYEDSDETLPEQENVDTNSKVSKLQSIKDSINMTKEKTKEKLQSTKEKTKEKLQSIPKSRYEWRKEPLPARFLGPKDHGALKHSQYKIFINPSITEVLCTTTAEALAMGKFVIIPVHPSNDFFYQFPNCLAYDDLNVFVTKMQYALTHDPISMSKESSYTLTWEAAMKRLVDSAAITEEYQAHLVKIGKITRDQRKAWIHKESGRVIKGELLRSLVGDPPKEDISEYNIGNEDDKNSARTGVLSFENQNPKLLMLLSFVIACLSYFFQR